MKPENSAQLSAKEIFILAAGMENAADRDALLQEHCSTNPDLLNQVQRLLAAADMDQSGSPLDVIVDAFGPEETRPNPQFNGNAQLTVNFDKTTPMTSITVGVQIGRYRLMEQLGEGGMGIVYVAEQLEPVRRKVALKVIKPGMDSKQVIARFEAERQALALMDHMNIARVLDGGTTEQGLPYFVMELVRGLTITEYCDQAKATTRDRLALFIAVCNAIQHAHQKGIIHRDIKPGNVLVTLHDGKPVVKVIDFGVAKALHQQLSQNTVYTALNQVVGTPLYMSPEQLELSGLDIDTRSDIYSMGVLLFELLTGTAPFDRERLLRSGFDEMRRIIREEEPPRPSHRVTTLPKAELSTCAKKRGLDNRAFTRSIQSELDWIVLKAMEKDRRRRYESARDFADDIDCYLTDRPVEACPPSIWYSVSKIAKRHRAAIVVAALLLTSLFGGLIATTTQVFRASIAEVALKESLANERRARKQADDEAEMATQAAARADSEAHVAFEVNKFLQDLFKLTIVDNQIEAKLDPDPNVTVRTLVDRASKTIDGQFSDAPLVEGSIHHTLGNVYLSIGVLESAAVHLEKAEEIARNVVGIEQSGSARAIGALSRLRTEQGRLQEAEVLAREALELSTRLEGAASQDAHGHLSGLIVVLFEAGKFNEAKAFAARQVDMCREQFGNFDRRTLEAMDNLASQLDKLGDEAEAYTLAQRVLEMRESHLGPTHPDTLHSVVAVAVHFDRLGQYSQAAKNFERVLKEYRSLYGPKHRLTIRAQANLGHVYTMQNKLDDAIQALEPALEAAEQKLGSESSITQTAQGFLAKVYNERKEFQRAIAMYGRLLAAQIAKLGERHPKVILTRSSLAEAMYNAGMVTDSAKEFSSAIEMAQNVLGKNHADTLRIISNSAVKMQAAGKNKEALDAFLMLRDCHLEKLGPYALETFTAEFNIAFVRHTLGQKSEALVQLEDLILRVDENLEVGHPIRLAFHMRHGFVLEENATIPDRHKQAADAYRKAFDGYLQSLGQFHSKTLEAMESHAFELIAADLVDEADEFLKTKIAETLRQYEPTHINTFIMRHLAGKLMLKAKRIDRAIPLLQNVHEAYMQQLGADDKKTSEVVWQLHQAYEMNNDPEKAKELVEGYLRSLAALANPRKGSILEAETRFVDSLMAKQEFTEAETRLMDILRRQPALFQPNSVEAADIHGRLALLFEKFFCFTEAEHHRRTEVEIRSEAHGQSHPFTFNSMAGLLTPLIQLEKFDEAESVLRKLIEHHEAKKSPAVPNLLFRNRLIRLFFAQGRFAEAEQMCLENEKVVVNHLSKTSITYLQNQCNWAFAVDQQGRHSDAEQRLNDALESLAVEGASAVPSQYSLVRLALVDLLLLHDRASEAVPLARANYQARLESSSPLIYQNNNAKYYLAKSFFADGKFEQAEPLLQELLTEKDNFLTRPQNYCDSMSMLGECLLLKKQYAESEPLLLDGYAGMEQRLLRATVSKSERQAMYFAAADRLVRLYEAISNPAQLERWQVERKRWTSPAE